MVTKFAQEIIAEIESDNKSRSDREKIRKIRRNKQRREKNRILRDLCGTSARAARLDMGL